MIKDRLYSEIFEEFENAETKAQRIEILRKYRHPRFVEFLEYTFNPNIFFDAPIPQNWSPAKELAGMNATYLELEVPKLYRFIKDHPHRPKELSKQKQEKLLKTTLESLHPDEAKLLIGCMNKDLGVKFLTLRLIQEAYN